jgi:hypothetical protein
MMMRVGVAMIVETSDEAIRVVRGARQRRR